jgi:hypothetical protein
MATLTQHLFRYSQTLGFYAQLGRGFNNPVDVALGRDGVLYVLNRAGSDIEIRMPYKRVTRCTLDEDYLGDISTGGTEDGQIMWPVAIALDADNHVYISDEALHRISIFDREGRFLAKWGVHGHEPGQFDRQPSGYSASFDVDDEGLASSYERHREAYIATFDRLGLDYVVVDAMSGAMGGSAGAVRLPINAARASSASAYRSSADLARRR